jgi:hypothetical protein
LLQLTETDLWPELRPAEGRPGELLAIYPHREAMPRETRQNFFESAHHEINVLDDSNMFLAGATGTIRVLAQKALNGIHVRIVLACTNGPRDSREVRSIDGDVRLHCGALYSSIFQADSHFLCSQHAYGISIARSQPCIYTGKLTVILQAPTLKPSRVFGQKVETRKMTAVDESQYPHGM